MFSSVKKDTKSRIITVTSLCAIVLLMGIVFASQAYSTAVDAVSINRVDIKEGIWNVGIKENTYKETEGSISPNTKILSNVIISEVTLTNPEEYIEYTFAIENSGTIDALLNNINIDGLNDNNNVTIKINNEEYNNKQEIVLENNSKNYITIRVETTSYEEQNLKLIMSLEFKQKQKED